MAITKAAAGEGEGEAEGEEASSCTYIGTSREYLCPCIDAPVLVVSALVSVSFMCAV